MKAKTEAKTWNPNLHPSMARPKNVSEMLLLSKTYHIYEDLTAGVARRLAIRSANPEVRNELLTKIAASSWWKIAEAIEAEIEGKPA